MPRSSECRLSRFRESPWGLVLRSCRFWAAVTKQKQQGDLAISSPTWSVWKKCFFLILTFFCLFKKKTYPFSGFFHPAAHHIRYYHWFPFISSIFDSLESDEVEKRRSLKEPLGANKTGRLAIPVDGHESRRLDPDSHANSILRNLEKKPPRMV